jgi:hypothetical protein
MQPVLPLTLRTFLSAQALFSPDLLFRGVLANSESNHFESASRHSGGSDVIPKRAKRHGVGEMNVSSCSKFVFKVNEFFMPFVETA